MPLAQAQAAKIFLFFLEPQPLFLDKVMRQSDAPASHGTTERLGKNKSKNKNGCAFSQFRTQT